MEHHHLCSSLQNCIYSVQSKITNHPTLYGSNSNKQCIIKGQIVVDHNPGQSGPGKSAYVQIYSCTQVDPSNGKGKLSERAYLKHGKSKNHNGIKTTTYRLKFYLQPDFGIPGAFLIENQHKNTFFLQSATLETPSKLIQFDCRSWVYPVKKTQTNRIFFSNTSYLPSETPPALVELRRKELKSLRGDGTGERKEWDRIYDYDYYNNLGNPDKGLDHIRPILGGSKSHPYPRRGRTGSSHSKEDPLMERRPEMINLDVYVPPDERFSSKKMSEFIGNSIQATVHFLIPEAKSLSQEDSKSFQSFDEIRDMFSNNRSQVVEGGVTQKLKKSLPYELFKEIIHASKEDPMKFPLPQIIADNELSWMDDEELGHQMLSGINPTLIQVLQKFPLQSKNGTMSSIKESDIKVDNLDGLTLDKVMSQWRIFVLDHHDYLMPFLSRINTNGICAYASRTLFFLRNDATLKPVAIELSLPGYSDGNEINRVFLPAREGTEAALWKMAKAHVAANDSAYHQLISHCYLKRCFGGQDEMDKLMNEMSHPIRPQSRMTLPCDHRMRILPHILFSKHTHRLHTHAVVEPFIIATRRQLSVMHPIHRLLDPHFKDTMHINALARSILVNSGGILEKTLFSGKFSMLLSSELYKEWRFDEQALPNNLLKRDMALEEPDGLTGVQLLFQDYPYGADGLEIWGAIKTWVTDFCSIFYKDDDSVRFDEEIQGWWLEIRNVGHGDKRDEKWWYQMTSLPDLVQTLTTLIWIASALHASQNFGQYSYAGYPPNRPTLCRKFIPEEGTIEFAEFLSDPDKYYLKMLPERLEVTLGVALMEILSRHISDEVYLGQRSSLNWTDNEEVLQKFKKFSENLQKIEEEISKRNGNPKLKNRWGPAKIPYRLLYPDTSKVDFKGGITGKGIPNSISI